MAFELPPLPYPKNALEPYISARTLEFHHGKHHQTYVTTLNELIEGSPLERNSLEEIVKATYKDESKAKVFNNAAQVWNHNFFWQVMKAGGGAAPGKVADAINAAFGSMEKFREQFSQAAVGRFGSGWAWLVNDGGKLKIGSTPNQDNPLMDSSEIKGTPLLCIDVWEHAYYLKYQNKRADYVAAWWNVVNWDEVAKRMV